MEGWKLQTAINNFTDACETDSPYIIKHAKDLRRAYDHLRNPVQQQDVVEQIAPLLDDPRAHVRQCAACVMMNIPLENSPPCHHKYPSPCMISTEMSAIVSNGKTMCRMPCNNQHGSSLWQIT
jgi:hypothetical protein